MNKRGLESWPIPLTGGFGTPRIPEGPTTQHPARPPEQRASAWGQLRKGHLHFGQTQPTKPTGPTAK